MKEIKPTQTEDSDQNIIEPNVFLRTEAKHKDWYDVNQMGRQSRISRELKKAKGTHKHSLRKET